MTTTFYSFRKVGSDREAFCMVVNLQRPTSNITNRKLRQVTGASIFHGVLMKLKLPATSCGKFPIVKENVYFYSLAVQFKKSGFYRNLILDSAFICL